MRLRRQPDQEMAERLSRLMDAGPQSFPPPAAPGSAATSPLTDASVPQTQWIVRNPVEPRPEVDRLRGWVPEPPAPERNGSHRLRVARPRTQRLGTASQLQPTPAPQPELDDLDRFLASQGLDGLGDVDEWNVDPAERQDQSWWARLSMPWRAAVALLVIGAIAVAVIAFRSMSGDRPGTVTAVPARSATASASATGGTGVGATPMVSGPSATAGAATAAARGPVLVYVTGQVRRPGVVKLAATSRVNDAIRAAGGLAPGADMDAVNLARVVQDGEQITVPRPGEQVTTPAGGGTAPSATTPPLGSSGSASGGAAGGKVNLNTASLSELDTLDGVGPVLAQRILDYRTQHGQFTSVAQLNEVSGIGEKLMARIGPQVTV